jgi:integrase
MDLYRQPGSKYFTADFTVDGRRIRKSTKQTTRGKALEVAAEFLRQAQDEEAPAVRGRAPRVRDYAEQKFLPFVRLSGTLKPPSKRYYQTGWKLLAKTEVVNWRLDQIDKDRADTLTLTGSGSNKNCALRTLRRILGHAEEAKVIKHAPKFKYHEEVEREATFDAATEDNFLSEARQPMRDVFLSVQDAGMRPDEVFRMKVTHVLWRKSLIFIPRGKSEKAHRHVPLSDRLRAALWARAQGTTSEWMFPSKRSRSGHLEHSGVAKAFRKHRNQLGITKDLVLYSARHTFGTDLMDEMGDLVKAGKVMGHSSTRITERYIHPELKQLAGTINKRNARRAEEAAEAATADSRHSLRHSQKSEGGKVSAND